MIKIYLNKKLNTAAGSMLLDIHLDIQKHTFLTIYGKSGAGKTSVLRMLSGLMEPDSGSIQINENRWYDSEDSINLPPQKRKSGLVFQDYALFPNMTIKENLEFALLKNQDKKIIKELIEIVELGDLQNQRPARLSGGQQQRVALARALVQRPEILMLDEPLSALDQEMRLKLQDYVLQLHNAYKLTTILVSHDIPEILKMSDQIAHLDQGRIIKQGPPEEFFNNNENLNPLPKNGKLIKVKRIGDKVFLTILIAGQTINIESSTDHFPDWKN